MTRELMTRPFQEEPDSALVGATKDGESEAFAFLVKRHESKMLAVAFRMTRNREDAQDIVQQGFYKAFLHLDAFQGKSCFSTWLTRIVMNEALMCMRKNRTVHEVSLEDMRVGHEMAIPTEIADPGASPAEIYGKKETERMLSKAMNQLCSEMRTALHLRLEDWTIEETAQTLGIGVGTLKARLFRARQRLRTLLAGSAEFPHVGQEARLARNKRQLAFSMSL